MTGSTTKRTMPETPADTIRRAAQLMRERAAKATPGPWTTEWVGQQCQIQAPNSADGEPIAEWTYAIATWEPEVHQQRAECQTGDAEHIAAIHPGVATAISDSWDATAKEAAHWNAYEENGHVRQCLIGTRHDWTLILAAARAYLGETP